MSTMTNILTTQGINQFFANYAKKEKNILSVYPHNFLFEQMSLHIEQDLCRHARRNPNDNCHSN